jgi:hypothetical protein
MPRAPLQRQAAQEDTILETLRALGLDPLALPPGAPGKPGVKAAVRKALGTGGMWAGRSVFNKAWDRLRQTGRVHYED